MRWTGINAVAVEALDAISAKEEEKVRRCTVIHRDGEEMENNIFYFFLNPCIYRIQIREGGAGL